LLKIYYQRRQLESESEDVVKMGSSEMCLSTGVLLEGFTSVEKLVNSTFNLEDIFRSLSAKKKDAPVFFTS
jgi:hypothetical protein